MRALRRTSARLILWASVLATGVLPNHCSTTLEDAVLQGVAQAVTNTTAGALESLLPFDFDGDGSGSNNGNGNGGDPFTNPPVQS